jgi:putative transposase
MKSKTAIPAWVGVAKRRATLAERFIRETCTRQRIKRGQLNVHADRGPAMTSKPWRCC